MNYPNIFLNYFSKKIDDIISFAGLNNSNGIVTVAAFHDHYGFRDEHIAAGSPSLLGSRLKFQWN